MNRNQSDLLLLLILVAMFALLMIGAWQNDDLEDRVEVLELIHAPAERP